MSAVIPEAYSRRSSLYRQLSGAEFTERVDSALPLRYQASDRQQAELLGLTDLSVLSRCGFRGTNAAGHLQESGLPVPQAANQLSETENGELVLRLNRTEYWVLSSLADSGAVERIKQKPQPASCYPLYCQDGHAWLMMTGQHLAETMAKVCGVDLRMEAFPRGSIAQTSVARVNAVIAHHECNGIPAFSILSDSASAEYLWQALLDAMAEFGGKPVGVSAFEEYQ